ncbi:MAG: substrate-binding domain-containing protein [Spirochaetota bacterium]|nr:substrate-binding domain-containing protein [Spirochaetota bacterium]
MKNTNRITRLLLILVMMAGTFILGLHEVPAQDDVVVIANNSKGSLSASQIKRIFNGDVTNWPDGGAVKVLLNNNSGITEQFCSKYLNTTPSKLDSSWVKKSIRDGTPTPRKVASNVIVTMVSNSPKFIGFVKRSEAGSSVKIID